MCTSILKIVKQSNEKKGISMSKLKTPEMGSDEAMEMGCSCRARAVRPNDIDPPEIQRDKWCLVHGRDPDAERDKMIDEKFADL